MKEAMDRFTQRIGANRFSEVANDYSNLATCLKLSNPWQA